MDARISQWKIETFLLTATPNRTSSSSSIGPKFDVSINGRTRNGEYPIEVDSGGWLPARANAQTQKISAMSPLQWQSATNYYISCGRHASKVLKICTCRRRASKRTSVISLVNYIFFFFFFTVCCYANAGRQGSHGESKARQGRLCKNINVHFCRGPTQSNVSLSLCDLAPDGKVRTCEKKNILSFVRINFAAFRFLNLPQLPCAMHLCKFTS